MSMTQACFRCFSHHFLLWSQAIASYCCLVMPRLCLRSFSCLSSDRVGLRYPWQCCYCHSSAQLSAILELLWALHVAQPIRCQALLSLFCQSVKSSWMHWWANFAWYLNSSPDLCCECHEETSEKMDADSSYSCLAAESLAPLWLYQR